MAPVEAQTAIRSGEPPPASEEADLRRARGGDDEAFERIVLAHQARVFSLALRLTGQRADAEDVAQDVFLKLHATLGQISTAAHLKHWLLRTVSHRAIDRQRQQARQGQQVPLSASANAHAAPGADSAEDPLATSILRRLLAELPPDARAVLVLRFQEDLDPAEIAAVLEMPVNTVKSHLRRSIEWLRTQYAGGPHGR